MVQDRVITAAWLLSHNACKRDIDVFIQLFGQEAPLTRANVERASAAGLDPRWFVKRWLEGPGFTEYYQAVYSAWVETQWVDTPAWLERDPTRAEYIRVEAQARAEYERVEAQAWAEHKQTIATALCDLMGLD